jgi:hypothetical protein
MANLQFESRLRPKRETDNVRASDVFVAQKGPQIVENLVEPEGPGHIVGSAVTSQVGKDAPVAVG